MDATTPGNLPVELWRDISAVMRDQYPEQPCVHGASTYTIDGGRCPDCPISNMHALVSLGLTCHFFRAVVQPVLYECVAVDLEKAHRPEGKKQRRLSRTIYRQKEHVRRFEMRNFPLFLQETTYVHMSSASLVRHLSIKASVISTALRDFLRRNQLSLRTLSLEDCDCPESHVWDLHTHKPLQLPNLTQLVWKSSPDFATHKRCDLLQPKLFFVPTLTRLTVPTDRLPQEALPFCSLLEMLSVDKATADLSTFLSFCPNIQELEVGEDTTPVVFPAEILPRLRSVTWGPTAIAALLPGRPIKSITTEPSLALFADPLPELEHLRLTSLSDICGGMAVMDLLLVACPNLLTLEIRSHERTSVDNMKTWITTSMATDIASLSRLRSLRVMWKYIRGRVTIWSTQAVTPEPLEGIFESWSQLGRQWRKEEEAMLIQMKGRCPDLMDVWVEPVHPWTYVWHEEAWLPTLRVL